MRIWIKQFLQPLPALGGSMIFMILRNDYIVEAILHMYTFWSFLASVHKVARLQAQQGTWN